MVVGPQVTVAEAALAWYDAGCNVIPAAADRTKRPAFEWKEFQYKRPSRELLQDDWLARYPDGIGLLCGSVSGNLEMLELEGRAASGKDLDAITEVARVLNCLDVWEMLTHGGYAEWTPSGGLHFLYRISDHSVPGNTKIARRPANADELAIKPEEKWKVLAETRGEGGYVIVAPSGGRTHPSGDTWSVAAGKIGVIPTITWGQRELLHKAFKVALDEMPAPPVYERPALRAVLGKADRPGDDFNVRGDWSQILGDHGWSIHHQTSQETYWTRPGKAKIDGWSATTGYANDQDRLFVWSSSTDFIPETPYSKFAAYTLLEHNGDYRASTKDLSAKGFGTPLERSSQSSGSKLLLDSIQTTGGQSPVLEVQEPAVPNTTAGKEAGGPATNVERDHLGRPAYKEEMLSSVPWTQVGIANLWDRIHRDYFAFNASQKQWMQWDGVAWANDEHQRAKNSAMDMMARLHDYGDRLESSDPEGRKGVRAKAEKLSTNQAISAVISLASTKPGIAVSNSDFDKPKHLITVRNGTFNLKTKQLEPHNPGLMLTRKVNASFDNEATKGRWTEFMEQVLPDPEVRQYLQRVCGYMLTGTLNERIMVLIHGESGTGKTQFLEALKGVLGDFAGIAPASSFQPRVAGYKGPSEDLHKLMGKRFVLQSELDAGSRLNESLVKSIVGADTQTSRPLYGAPIDWVPEYTVFMATNYLPRISSSDNAIWNRVKPVKFEQVFINESGQALEPGDRNLGRKMAETEPEVILNWLLEGLADYEANGLREPAQVKAWLNDYREEVDTTRQFMTEAPEEGRIVLGEGQEIGSRDLYRIYAAFCQDNSQHPVGSKTFTERMTSNGHKSKRTEKGTRWIGIGITGFIREAQTPAVGFYRRS